MMRGLVATLIAVQRDYCRAHGVSPRFATIEMIVALLQVAALCCMAALALAAVPS